MSSRVHIERRKTHDRRSGAERRSDFVSGAELGVVPTRAPFFPSFRDDEISLADIWLVLWRHKRLIAAIVALSLAAGVGLALVKPKKYGYSSTLEIGTTLVQTAQGLETQPIDSPNTALAKIQNSFIPAVIDQYARQHKLDPAEFKLEASIPDKSQLLVVSGKGTTKQADAYKAMIAAVVARLVADHRHLMQAARARYEAQLVAAKSRLEQLQDPTNLKLQKLNVEQAIKQQQDSIDDETARISFLKTKIKRLDDTDRILKTQITHIERQLAASRASQSEVLTSAHNEATALTTLMVSNEVLQARRRLGDLQERLEVAQPNLRQQLLDQIATVQRGRDMHRQKIAALQDKLTKLVNDNQRAIVVQTQNVSQLNTRIQSLRETHGLTKPMRSVKPVGIGRTVLVLLFAFLGTMLAAFAAFVGESIGKARTRMYEPVRQLEAA